MEEKNTNDISTNKANVTKRTAKRGYSKKKESNKNKKIELTEMASIKKEKNKNNENKNNNIYKREKKNRLIGHNKKQKEKPIKLFKYLCIQYLDNIDIKFKINEKKKFRKKSDIEKK